MTAAVTVSVRRQQYRAYIPLKALTDDLVNVHCKSASNSIDATVTVTMSVILQIRIS